MASDKIYFFEYGVLMHPKEMRNYIQSSAKEICRAKVKNAKLTFSGPVMGYPDMDWCPGKGNQIYGVVYKLTPEAVQKIKEKTLNYYRPKLVEIEIVTENGKVRTVYTLKSDSEHRRIKDHKAHPHSLMCITLIEAYTYWHLNKEHLDKAINEIPAPRINVHKKVGRDR